MSRANSTSSRSGFTLVELLVIAPIALLVITGFIALMVTMVGDVLVSRGSNVMTYDIQNALSTIEDDVRLSTEFLTTTGSLPSPQGKNDNTQAFTGSSSELILGEIATDKNPIDPLRRFVHYNTPLACGSDQEYQNRLFFVTVVYYVKGGSLWRRTYVPTPAGTLCKTPWQVNTCSPDYTAARCQANDSEVLKDIKSFNIDYFVDPEDVAEVGPSLAGNASTLQVTIEGEKIVAGRTINATSTSRVTKLSSLDVNLAPPDPPVVTGTNSGRTAVFSWPGVPTASSYIVKYNINGGGWITSSENTTETSFSVPANHGDTVSVEVMARNTTGASAGGTASTQIPTWIDCSLLNGWKDYSAVHGESYTDCGFTKTKDGVVVVKGLIVGGATTGSWIPLFQLPEGYRPTHSLLFGQTRGGNGVTRVDVGIDGTVTLQSASASASQWLSLNEIRFIPADSAYSWTPLTLQNGWTNWGANHPPLRVLQDASGRIHMQGVIRQGTYTSGTVITTVPSGYADSSTNYLIPTYAATGHNFIYLAPSNNITPWGTDTGDSNSIQSMTYPASYAGWQSFAVVAGAPASGQVGNGWIRYSTAFTPPQYTKASDGIVTLRGMVRGDAAAYGAVMAVLPPGYRPSERVIVTTINGGVHVRFDILPNGQIIPYHNTSMTWLTMDNVSFIAEN